ncbi:MAG: agmatine deiminase family protein [Candidatus Xenobia bacterium]
MLKQSPRALGYRMPAEWARHDATWISWPHDPNTWPEKVTHAEHCVARWVRALVRGERVEINVLDETHRQHVMEILRDWDVPLDDVGLHLRPTADAWIRDYGPSFVVGSQGLAAICWEFDAWGGKGEQYYGDRRVFDTKVARDIASSLDVPHFAPGIVLEGGSIEVNGEGTLMATRECLLDSRSRPAQQQEVEAALRESLGVEHVLWLANVPMEGDDTDGHIDNLARFVGPHTVLTVIETDRTRPLYEPLQQNLRRLEAMRVQDGKQLTVVTVPLPAPFHYRWAPYGKKARQQFPASYANFYIGNEVVLVPVYADANDHLAVETIRQCFPDRAIIGIDCCDYILGQGAIHCSTQQQPAI